MTFHLNCIKGLVALAIGSFLIGSADGADPVKITVTLMELDDDGERPAAGVYVVADPRFSTDKSKTTDGSGSVTFELPSTESVAIKVGSRTRNEKVLTISGRFDQKLSHLIIRRSVPYTVSVALSYDAVQMESRVSTIQAPKLDGDVEAISTIRELLYDQLNHAGGRLMSSERRQQIEALEQRILSATEVDANAEAFTREAMQRTRKELLDARKRLLDPPFKLGVGFTDIVNVGTRVEDVVAGGAADRASLIVGDVITHVDGVIVHRSGLAYLIANANQREVELRVRGTDGNTRKIDVELSR